MNSQATLLTQIYSDFKAKNFEAVLKSCSDEMTFQVPGKSPIAGKFTKANVVDALWTRQQQLSQGSFQMELHDVMTSDSQLHATAVVTYKLNYQGKVTELRTVHVWRFEKGQPLAWYEYPRDLYQFDACWSH